MMKFLLVSLTACLSGSALAQDTISSTAAKSHADVIFTGGHDTVGEDRGRPVILIAAALKVPPEVFRATFRNVRPAPAGEQPDPAQVVRNKQALLDGLGPYGVTNDRLDEVSNYYRYRRSAGEMWRNTPAKAFATIRDGVVTGITITDGGSGYSSAPTVSLAGMPSVTLKATLAFGTELAKNGSVAEIKIGP